MFSVKGPRGNISGFAGHRFFTAAAQLCRCSEKAATDKMQTDECGSVAIKPFMDTKI